MPDDLHFPTFRTPRRAPQERRLVCGMLDFNDLDIVQRTVKAMTEILADPAAWHRLEVRNQCFFRTSDRRPPASLGWYLICEGQRAPLYAGQTENLDNRLNSDSGSLDQFARRQRDSDLVRNFIKRLCTIGYIDSLCVGVIAESDLLRHLGFSGPLETIDRNNVEKILGLFRNKVVSTP